MNLDVEQRVQSWLAAHYGIIGRTEALTAGLTAAQIKSRVHGGRWQIVCRGVYHLAGAPMGPLARFRVAVLVGGRGCALSHGSAAWLWGIAGSAEPGATPTITVPRNRLVRIPGLDVVRSRRPGRVVWRRGLPCTDPIRTIIDCASRAAPEELDGLVDRALAQRVVRHERLVKAVAGSAELRHHRGRPLLVARFRARGVTGSPHPSVLESRMSRLLRRFHIPEPKAELWWGPERSYRLDFAFPDLRLVIEVDGYAAHSGPEKQRYDRHRDQRLRRLDRPALRLVGGHLRCCPRGPGDR
jgi:hypothetical protein